MTYEEARKFIDSSSRYGSKLGLTIMTELLDRLDNPQDKLKIIHVAGTNGKGSTTAFIVSILAAEGYCVGRYISPAVFSYLERVQISYRYNEEKVPGNGERLSNNKADMSNEEIIHTDYISEQGVAAAIALIQPVCEKMVQDGFDHPTSFEIETAMAFLYLLSEQVDFAVIEVGLGGRLDATNVIKRPVCSVITSISMDHMHFLGDTLGKIAREKAGIIKRGAPVVTGNKNPEVLEVLRKIGDELDTRLVAVEEETTDIRYTPEYTEFSRKEMTYRIRLLGEYQVDNALLALKAADTLRDLGYPIQDSSIENGLFHTKWNGRFEIIARNPYFIIDGAHNEDAALKLRKSLLEYFPDRSFLFIMGVLADKEYSKILKITAPLARVLITLTPNNSRALDSGLLAEEAAKFTDIEIINAVTSERAIKSAYEKAASEDIIVAFGSLSYLSEIREGITSLEQE